MRKIVPGTLAGLVVAALLAAPAFAATVSVRIEGDALTLLPRTVVTTSGQPVGKPGSPTCPGNSALDAVNVATGGNWQGVYDATFSSYSLDGLLGESHPIGGDRYWSFWVNDGYAPSGVCGVPVQNGDSLLFYSDCGTAACTSRMPLRLTGVPAKAAPGATVTVKVEQLDGVGAAPAAGATVAFGGVTATTGANGTAAVTVAGSGPEPVHATKAGFVRSATETACVTTGSDGACGSTVPGGTGTAGITLVGIDTTAPTATIAGLKKRYAHGRGPRELRGTVSADPSGIKSVRLAISRRKGDRCWTFAGGRERFVRHRCGGWKSFKIGDRADWSYLLPERLGPGRYTIRVVAIDKAGNDGATRERIRVR